MEITQFLSYGFLQIDGMRLMKEVKYMNKDKKLAELKDSASDILLDYTSSIDELHDVVDEIMEKVVEVLEDKDKED